MPEVRDRRVVREGSGSVDNKNRIPEVVIQDNKVYCDGIHVFREHLSMKELAEYFPEEYQDIYKGEIICPICEKRLQHANANTLRQHCRMGHAEWYDVHHPVFNLFNPKEEGFKPLLEAIRKTTKDEPIQSEKEDKPNFEINEGIKA